MSADGYFLSAITGSDLKLYKLIGNNSVAQSFKPQTDATNIAFTPDLQLGVSVQDHVLIFDVRGKLLESVKFTDPISIFKFGWKQSRYIYAASGSKITLHDRKDRKIVNNIQVITSDLGSCFLSSRFTRFKQTPGTVISIAISPDDQKIACGCDNGTIMVYSLKTNTPAHLISKFNGKVTSLQFYPFKKSILVAGGEDGSIRMFDINQSLSPIQTKADVHSAPITGIAFAPCNKHFYCSVV
jgi:protein NEDD1